MVESPQTERSDPAEQNPLAALTVGAPYLSPLWRLWLLGFEFGFILLVFFLLIVMPENLISRVILAAALALAGYLWSQEVREEERVREMNDAFTRAHLKLQKAELDTITTLIHIVEEKDPLAHGHSERVAQLAVEIAKSMEYSAKTLETIRRAALLHDLGKLAIRDEILRKPAKLNEEEWALVKQHPQLAANILSPLKFLSLEQKIILHHHERVDGGGYPAGLKDEDIPLEARIIAVVETFDEMNNANHYRPQPLPKEVIVTELRKVSGTQLDSTMVERLLKILEKNPQLWCR